MSLGIFLKNSILDKQHIFIDEMHLFFIVLAHVILNYNIHYVK
ncbi:hypothetical protein FSS13T_17450 [Flavobacterium saliperosum S13]|uniref:Uncharacterized protein n=1 Tax=Flavobacterium saliperosum S13 TaxID=1341155 RepID=A0ABN0QG10_9FLAO|nr:hypothetical protein FSS13T_17450 [Flavobacterium saliperosum S13]